MACHINIFFTTFLFATGFERGIGFSYNNQSAWLKLGGSHCGGNRQSPINIVTNNLEDGDDIGLIELAMQNFDNPVNGTWKNNGSTLFFTPDSSATVATTSTYLGEYKLLQFHFHWGADNQEGSENRVNGNQYSGELHFVHIRESSMSIYDGDRFTVVAVFIESDENMELSGIWEKLSNIPDFNQSLSVSNIVYNDLLPESLDYYYFNGSLTTPLCNETVQWVVLQSSISAPAKFFSAIRKTQQANFEFLRRNFREVQNLHRRQVYQYNCTAYHILPIFGVLLVSVIAMLYCKKYCY